MNESYAEAGCKRKDTPTTYAIRIGMIVLAIIFFFLTMVSQLLILLSAISIFAIIYLFPKLNVEYEYIFCDGQLDFDRIRGGQKRKTMKRIDFEQVEMCAPLKSHAMDGYTYQDMKVIDFSSGNKDAKRYAIIVRDKGAVNKIIFEPTQKMLECIRLKAPRKIVLE